MSQMKGQHKAPEKTTKWKGEKQPYRKRIQNNDSEDNSGPQKMNGSKDWEHAWNVDRMVEITATEQNIGKRMKRNEGSLRDLWDNIKHTAAAAAAAKSPQSCPTLCDPIDGSPPGFAVPGILQVRTLEWVAIFFSNAWKWKVKVKSLSRVWLLATPWTAAYQAPPSMGFSRQDYWSRVPLPSPLNTLIFAL